MANIAQAIRLALHVGETHLGVQDIFGEDVGPPLGGVFTCTQGLRKAWNSPLDERGIVATAIGLALAGQRPVAEVQFSDYIFNTIDLLKLAANTCWSTNGQFDLPLVIMTPSGAGIHGSIYHSHSFESMAAHIPGLKVLFPSNPRDVYGLLISAIRDPNPVLFMYPKALIRVQTNHEIPGVPTDAKELSRRIDAPLENREGWVPQWPEYVPFSIPIGVAEVLRSGDDLTLVTYGRHAPMSAQAADLIRERLGARIDVIDLRTLVPYDWASVESSLKRTGRLLVVNEDTSVSNFGEHLIRRALDTCFYALEAPPRLLAGMNTPGIGLAQTLEMAQVPQVEDIVAAATALIEAQA